MSVSRFFRYELRTVDVEAARAFYVSVLGDEMWNAEFSASPLPERALAMGARSHWLGLVGVEDVDAMVQRMEADGCRALGPVRRSEDGSAVHVLRDPFGAIVGVSGERVKRRGTRVAWHLSISDDHVRAAAFYEAHFGWTAGPERALPDGTLHRSFAWTAGGDEAGSLCNAARPPTTHPQWLYFFPVIDLEASLATVRALGGLTLPAATTLAGDRVAACDDAQGAAFGLYEFVGKIRDANAD